MPRSRRGAGGSAKADQAPGAELDAATRAVEGAVLDALWRQWAAIGAGAAARGKALAVVDPEALVMASLWFLDEEPRLGDLLASWVVLNAGLMSVQRLRNVAMLFPAVARDRVSAVARLALEQGKDFRWKPLVRPDVTSLAERPGRAMSVAVPFERPRALMLRLRGLLGVGMRADVIAFLLSGHHDYVTADRIATATVYNLAAVRRLLAQLAGAGGVSVADGTRPAYSIKGTVLSRVAGRHASSVPRWRYAAQVFALVTEYLEWRRATRGRVVTPFAAAVKGDELFARHRQAFLEADLAARNITTTVGDQWPTVLLRLAGWVKRVM